MQKFMTFIRNITGKRNLHLRHLLQVGILMEDRGRNFYLILADKVMRPDVKKLCNKLADDELRHKKLIEDTLSEWLSLPIYKETQAGLEQEMNARRLFLNPPSFESTEDEMVRYAIEQEIKSVDFYMSFETAFPEAWKRMHVQNLVMEEKSHANELIVSYPQFKDMVV